MQVRTWKFITAGLVLVIIILCMMTFFLNGSNKNLLIQLNRADREKAQLSEDYEKLYAAYYSYDKKVEKLLETHPNVFWAQDSSAYVVKNGDSFLFSFYKKPRMYGEQYLFLRHKVSLPTATTWWDMDDNVGRVDTLKSHQFIFFSSSIPELVFVSGAIDSKSDTSKIVSTIYVK